MGRKKSSSECVAFGGGSRTKCSQLFLLKNEGCCDMGNGSLKNLILLFFSTWILVTSLSYATGQGRKIHRLQKNHDELKEESQTSTVKQETPKETPQETPF